LDFFQQVAEYKTCLLMFKLLYHLLSTMI